MKTKHTPGPWKITESQADGSPLVVSDEDDVCRVDDINPCGEANANLIAAAPELLYALKASLSYLENIVEPNHTRNDLIDYLKHAITKAEERNESSPAL